MKKIFILLLAALMMVGNIHAQDDTSVYRFAVLEALIANHKALSNRLRDRTEIDAAVTIGTYRTTDETENYEDIVCTMQKRIEGAQASVQFALDLASLTSMAVKTAQLSTDAVESALNRIGDNPLIIEATAHVIRQSGISINTFQWGRWCGIGYSRRPLTVLLHHPYPIAAYPESDDLTSISIKRYRTDTVC